MQKRIKPSQKIKKRFTAAASAAILALGAVPQAYAAEQTSAFRFTYPLSHSFEEINQYAAAHPYDVNLADAYEIQPDIANQEWNAQLAAGKLDLTKDAALRDRLAGKLTDATLQNALNATNFMRYHAGLQPLTIHTADAIGGKQWRAQAGAALLAELGQMTHNVAKADALAAGVSEALYGWAKAGPAQSNAVAGYGVAAKVVNSFMPDIGNDHTGLSHRSYILFPALESTGFGAANIAGKGSAVLMHVTWFGSDPQGISAVMWPSEKQPIETFQARGTWQMAYPEGNPYQGNPWSFFLNTTEAKVDAAKLKVTLTCNGQTEVLDGSVETKERLFTIGSFPLKTLIAWRPYNAYSAGDKVRVMIEGIEDAQGLAIPVSYDVHFFKTGTLPHPNLEGISVNRQTAERATIQFTSDRAGKLYYLVREADASAPSMEEVAGGKELLLDPNPATLQLEALAGNTAKKLYYITLDAAGTVQAAARESGEESDMLSIEIPAAPEETPIVTEPIIMEPITYAIRARDARNGSVSVSLRRAEEGERITVIAEPDEGYLLASLTVEDRSGEKVEIHKEGSGEYCFLMPAEAVTVETEFETEELLKPKLPEQPETPEIPSISDISETELLPFADVSTEDYFYDAIRWSVQEGVSSGVDEVFFAPYASCSRAQMMTFLWRASGCPEPNGAELSFRDIAADAYYEKAVRWAVENGVVKGVSGTQFAPEQTVTRGQTAAFLYRMAGAAGSSGTTTFRDVSPREYYADAVAWAAENGIVSGIGDGLFAPEAACSRAQIITMLYRAEKR